MVRVEIHKNGINAHNSKVSYYAIDFDTKKQIAESTNLEWLIKVVLAEGYKDNEIQYQW